MGNSKAQDVRPADNSSDSGTTAKRGWELIETSLPARELKSNPRVLVFSGDYQQAQLTTLHVTNADEAAVIFCIKKSYMPDVNQILPRPVSPSPLVVKPSCGWIPPGQTIDVQVMLEPKSKWRFELKPDSQWILKALVLESARISSPDLLPTDRKLKAAWKGLLDDNPLDKALCYKRQRSLVRMALPWAASRIEDGKKNTPKETTPKKTIYCPSKE